MFFLSLTLLEYWVRRKFMSNTIELVIKNYTDDVKKQKIKMPTGFCIKCSEKPDFFKRHDCRERIFQYISGPLVKNILSFLVRWKCPLCKTTFTDYPDFAEPYKKYIAKNINDICFKYITEDLLSYRKAAKTGGACIGYNENGKEFCDIFLSHSTIWKWISSLGDKINQSERNKNTKSISISTSKYRSVLRKKILENAYIFLSTFANRQFFPHLGTPTA